MKIRIFYLTLAVVPLLLSPIFQIIHHRFRVIALGNNPGLGSIGHGMMIMYSAIFIGLLFGLGAILYLRMQDGVIILNPLKLIIQFDGVAKNIIRLLGYLQIFFSFITIMISLPDQHRTTIYPFELLSGIFGIIGAILFILVFCSVMPASET